MKITRRDIANYRLLGILLDKDRRKLQMEEQIKTDMEYLHKLEMEIDKVIADCKDIEDKVILEYTKDGLSQQEIALKLRIDQSLVSRRIKKYVSD